MKCTACGNDNQPGAKFCVHCGVVLSASVPAYTPAPAQAPAAAVQTGTRPAMPAAPTPAAAVQTGPRPVAPAPPPPAPAAPQAAPLAEAPASSRNMGVLIAALAALIVLAAGGYFGYRMFAGETPKQTTVTTESPKSESPAPTQGAEPPKETAGAPATSPEAASAVVPVGGAQTQAGAPAAPGTAMTNASPLPGEPAVAPDKSKAPAKTQAKAAAEQPSPTTPAAQAPAAAPSPAAAKAPPKTTVAAAQPDRWQMYAEEMANCAKEDFFSRLGCQQKTRVRYCEGYWGKVPQCPQTPPVDRGQ
jgi:hypothetical protein